MNRAARRHAAKTCVSHKDVLQHIEKEQIQKKAEDAADKVMLGLLGLPCLVLKDKFGFGKVRLERFTDALLDMYDSYTRGYITVDDVLEVLEHEAGLIISKKD